MSTATNMLQRYPKDLGRVDRTAVAHCIVLPANDLDYCRFCVEICGRGEDACRGLLVSLG